MPSSTTRIRASAQNASLRAGLLTGAILGRLALEESSPSYYCIELNLVRCGDRIEGFTDTNFRKTHGNVESPTRARLERVAASQLTTSFVRANPTFVSLACTAVTQTS
jgi:hypothetical protein